MMPILSNFSANNQSWIRFLLSSRWSAFAAWFFAALCTIVLVSCDKSLLKKRGFTDGDISIRVNGEARYGKAKSGTGSYENEYLMSFLFPYRANEGDFRIVISFHSNMFDSDGDLTLRSSCDYNLPSCSTSIIGQYDNGPANDLLLSSYLPDSTYDNRLTILSDGRGGLEGMVGGRFVRPVATDPLLTRYPDTLLLTDGRFEVQFDWPL